MKATPRLAALLCLVTCLGTITPLPLTAQTPAADAKKERVIAELELHNTPVRDVVAFLRQQAPEANIVVGAGAGDVRVSELKLRNVTLTQALAALVFATNHEVITYPPGAQAPGIFTVVATRSDADKQARLASITRVFVLPSWPDADFDKQLAAMLDAVKHLFTLTREAREAAGEATTGLKPPAMEAHRPTHLLLVAGTREGVELAGQVITALLGKTVETDPASTPDSPAQATVLGQVQKPGVYAVGDGTLAQLIARAGGVTSTGNSKRIGVRSKDGRKTEANLSSDAGATIKEGDIVTVPERFY